MRTDNAVREEGELEATTRPGGKESPLVPWWAWALLAVLLIGPLLLGRALDWEHFADYGGLLQGVAGSVALLLVWRTMLLQRDELALQRQELTHTRQEMQRGNSEHKQQTKHMQEQLHQFIRQGDLIREQMDRAVRPVFVSSCEFQRPTGLVLALKNIGKDRGIVRRVRWRGTAGETSQFGDLFQPALAAHPRLACRLDEPASLRTEITVNDILTMAEVRVKEDPGGELSSVLEELRAIRIHVEYTDIFGTPQTPLEIDLGAVIAPTTF